MAEETERKTYVQTARLDGDITTNTSFSASNPWDDLISTDFNTHDLRPKLVLLSCQAVHHEASSPALDCVA